MDKFIHIKDQSTNTKRKLLPIGLRLDKLWSVASSGHAMILKTSINDAHPRQAVQGSILWACDYSENCLRGKPSLSTVGRDTVPTHRFSRSKDELEQ